MVFISTQEKSQLNNMIENADLIFILSHIFQLLGWAFLPLLMLPIMYFLFSKNQFLKSLSFGIVSTIDTFNYYIGEIVKWLLPLMVLTISFSIFALSIFGKSWTKLFETSEYFHASVIMLGAASTLLAGKHVRVDIFYSKMNNMSRSLVEIIGFYSLLLPVCIIILWNSQSFVRSSWMILEGSSEIDGIKGEFLLKTLIPIFSVLMIIQGLSISLRAVMYILRHEKPLLPLNFDDTFINENSFK